MGLPFDFPFQIGCKIPIADLRRDKFAKTQYKRYAEHSETQPKGGGKYDKRKRLIHEQSGNGQNSCDYVIETKTQRLIRANCADRKSEDDGSTQQRQNGKGAAYGRISGYARAKGRQESQGSCGDGDRAYQVQDRDFTDFLRKVECGGKENESYGKATDSE